MTKMPPISSATAKVAKNIFSPMGTRFPNILNMPNEKAMSVAMGMALPCKRASSADKRRYIVIGNTIPPTAAITGKRAFFIDDNSPTRTSRFISKPTEKKNMAIKASLMTCIRVMGCPWCSKRLKFPICNKTGCCHHEK